MYFWKTLNSRIVDNFFLINFLETCTYFIKFITIRSVLKQHCISNCLHNLNILVFALNLINFKNWSRGIFEKKTDIKMFPNLGFSEWLIIKMTCLKILFSNNQKHVAFTVDFISTSLLKLQSATNSHSNI